MYSLAPVLLFIVLFTISIKTCIKADLIVKDRKVLSIVSMIIGCVLASFLNFIFIYPFTVGLYVLILKVTNLWEKDYTKPV